MEEKEVKSFDEESSRRLFRLFLIAAIFVVIIVLIFFIVYIFVSSKKEVSKLGEEEIGLSLSEAKEQIKNCLSEEISCDELFLRKDIVKICKELAELKNDCFYESAVINNKKEHCKFIDGELKEACESSIKEFSENETEDNVDVSERTTSEEDIFGEGFEQEGETGETEFSNETTTQEISEGGEDIGEEFLE